MLVSGSLHGLEEPESQAVPEAEAQGVPEAPTPTEPHAGTYDPKGFRAQILYYEWLLGPKALLFGSLDP